MRAPDAIKLQTINQRMQKTPFILRLIMVVMIAVLLSLSLPMQGAAQGEEFDPPYYVVQKDDSLWGIAVRFGVTMEELQTLNAITDPNALAVGTSLFIPHLSGYSGQIGVHQVIYGDTLQSLSRKYGLSEGVLASLNRITSPTEVIAGSSLIVPVEREYESMYQRISLAPGQSILELAMKGGQNPWVMLLDNNLWNSWAVTPGSSIQISNSVTSRGGLTLSGLPAVIEHVEITPFSLSQGVTMTVKVQAPPDSSIIGSFAGRKLNFFQYEGNYVALQGVHTLMEPGPYPLALKVDMADGTEYAFSQYVLVTSTDYIYDPMLTVDPETVVPAVTEPENELWDSLGATVTQEKMWNGSFTSPVPLELADCWTSFFGNRRAYNGSQYEYYHSGLDFCGLVGTELYAPAGGKISYTGSLVVRGNVVVIDHGWGVYTAYDHLSEILVKPGDVVMPGQTIGLGGATGRTTGPHLHWEVWVGGVQVDPADWLGQVYP